MSSYASVHVDLDGWWTYCAAYGECAGAPPRSPLDPDPIFSDALPRLRDLLESYGVRATFFVVGADLTVPWKRRMVQSLARNGHEIANHTFCHTLGLPGRLRREIAAEIERGSDAIAEAIGCRPVGFRAPGYAIDELVYSMLEDRSYRYDTSLLPTFWGGALRGMQRRGRRGRGSTDRPSSSASLPEPKLQFGRAAYGLAPSKPYYPSRRCLWRSGEGKVLEVPVTTMPYSRLPFHSTCVFALGREYLSAGLSLCRAAGIPVTYLFHAIDLIDDEIGAPLLERIGIRASLDRRLGLCNLVLSQLTASLRVVRTCDLLCHRRITATTSDGRRLPSVAPR